MPAAITVTTDTTYMRAGVTLSGWVSSGAVEVFRVHDVDGQRYPMRDVSLVSAGSAFGYDYETPVGAAFHYEADDGATTVVSASTSLPGSASRRVWLSVPGLPSYLQQVELVQRPVFKRARPSAPLKVLGRTNPIVLSDTSGSPEFTLMVQTRSDSDAYLLEALLQVAPVLLLRIPGTRLTDWAYVQVFDIDEAPVTATLPALAGVGADHESHWSRWSIGMQVVDAPVGGVFGDPTATWDAIADAYSSWNALAAAKATWLDAARGV